MSRSTTNRRDRPSASIRSPRAPCTLSSASETPPPATRNLAQPSDSDGARGRAVALRWGSWRLDSAPSPRSCFGVVVGGARARPARRERRSVAGVALAPRVRDGPNTRGHTAPGRMSNTVTAPTLRVSPPDWSSNAIALPATSAIATSTNGRTACSNCTRSKSTPSQTSSFGLTCVWGKHSSSRHGDAASPVTSQTAEATDLSLRLFLLREHAHSFGGLPVQHVASSSAHSANSGTVHGNDLQEPPAHPVDGFERQARTPWRGPLLRRPTAQQTSGST